MLDQEKISGERVDPPYSSYIQSYLHKLFTHGTQFSRECYHVRCVNVVVRERKCVQSFWGCSRDQNLHQGTAIAKPYNRITESESDLKITLEGLL